MFSFLSSPNRIDTIAIAGFAGKLGLVACPGVRLDDAVFQKKIVRNARRDVQEFIRWDAYGVVTLMEESELCRYGLQNLPDLIEASGLWWRYLPIRDMYVPDERFERRWEIEGEFLRSRLRDGERIIIHCFAGLGRTGLIAARILVELGLSPAEAIQKVRGQDARRIQTESQFNYISNCHSKTKRSTAVPPITLDSNEGAGPLPSASDQI